MVLDRKSSQEYLVNAGVRQGINDVICDIAIHADNTTLYSKCDQASDL